MQHLNRTAAGWRAAAGIGISVWLLAAGTATANGFRNPPPGAAALAIDGGRRVLIDDASALVHNPANLVDLAEPQTMVALTVLHAETDHRWTIGGTVTTDDPWKFLPAVFAVWPLDAETLRLGLAVTSPYGQSTDWGRRSLFPNYYSELAMIDIAPTVALRLNDQLSVGAGVDVYLSSLDLRQAIPWGAFTGMQEGGTGLVRMEGDGVAVGGNLAATLRLTPNQRIAVTYALPFDVEYEGDATIAGIPPALWSVLAGSSDFDAEISFPAVAGMGYGCRFHESLQVGVDAEWVEFSRNDNILLDMGVNSGPGRFPDGVAQDWEDIWAFGAAAAWQTSDAVNWRASYKFLESPIPDRTFSSSLPDTDRHVLAAGLGLRQGDHVIDLAYAYTLFEDRTVRGAIDPLGQPGGVNLVDGEYELSSHIVSVSYGLSF